MSAKVGDHVRRATDGQLGEVIERDGVLMVKLDRGVSKNPLTEHVDAYGSKRWLPAERRLPLAPAVVGKIAYEAVSLLRRHRGEYGLKGWDALTESEQKKFQAMAPTDDEQRALWEAITSALLRR